MKILLTLSCSLLLLTAHSQSILDGFKKKSKDSTTTGKSVGDVLRKVTAQQKSGLTTDEVVAGLKEALQVGAGKAGEKLSLQDGFFRNQAIKILMPPEAKKVEQTLRKLGMGKLVDDAILSMNRAAEDAAKSAAPIFVDAIKGMTIQDGWNILKGSDTAATAYLRGRTTKPLTEAFRPVIEKSVAKVDATKYWNTVFTNYNRVATNKVNPDLAGYVTERALAGLFVQLGEEEKDIRKNPVARTTDLLKKVFGAGSK